MPPRPAPHWKLEVVYENRPDIAAVHVHDPAGRHVASFFGSGIEPPETADQVPSAHDALRYARNFVWSWGGRPVVEGEE